MQVSDREIQAEEFAPDASPTDSLVGALQGFYRAFQRLAIYPSGHPSVPQAIELAVGRFHQALERRASLVIGVTRDELIWEGEQIGEGSDPLRSLAIMLHDLDLAAVEFRAGLGARELETLVHLLARSRKGDVRGAQLVDEFERERVENLALCAIDYRALSFGDGVASTSSDETATPWRHLSGALTDPATFATGSDLTGLADEVSAQIHAQEGTGVGGLRSELHRQLRDMDSLAEQQREAVRQRMGNFVGALHPELRRNLLKVGASRGTESLSIMAELADTIPPPELLEALKHVDQVGGHARGELVTLLKKLVRISRDRPPVRTELEETLGRWGVSSSALYDSGKLGTAVEEVFQRRTEAQYNPEEYQALLGGLANADLLGDSPASAALYLDPTDETGLRLHCAEIAVRLLGRSDGDEQRAALFGYVGARVDEMLEHGRVSSVEHAAVAARSDRLLKSGEKQIRVASEGFLEDFRGDARIELILDLIRDGKARPSEALKLLDLGGSRTLDAVLDRLATGTNAMTESALENFCKRCAAHLWKEVVPRRSGAGWAPLEPVFPFLRDLSPEVALPLLQPLLDHEESRVRCEALIVICEIDSGSCVDRFLGRALADESLRVVTTAIRRLAAVRTPEALALLGSFVAGQRENSFDSSEACALAAELLLEQGDPGCEQLCRALDELRSQLSRKNARRARWLVKLLSERRPDSAQVRSALKRWQRSPARVLSRVLPKIKTGSGAETK